MTRTTDTTPTDAQRGDQSPGRGASARADADDGSGSSSPEREAATGRSNGVSRRHRERPVVVGEDTAEREVVVRKGAVETAPPATGTVGTVRVPAAASPAEADAIAAAVREHLVATGSASAANSPARWVAAGRVRGVVSDPEAVLDDAESDPWIAASRAHDRR